MSSSSEVNSNKIDKLPDKVLKTDSTKSSKTLGKKDQEKNNAEKEDKKE